MTKNDITTANKDNIIELTSQKGIKEGLLKMLTRSQMLLPKTLEIDRIIAAAGFYIANNKNSKTGKNDLMALSPENMYAMLYGVQKEAMLFLEAGTDYDIILFKGKPVITRKKEGWYKLIDMIKPAEIIKFVSNVATTGDTISYNPVTEEITHEVNGERHHDINNIIGAYVYIKFANGFEKAVFWNVDDIKRAKEAAPGGDSEYSPWAKHSIKMVETKVVKELAKQVFVLFGRRLSPMMNAVAMTEEIPAYQDYDRGLPEVAPHITEPPKDEILDMNGLVE